VLSEAETIRAQHSDEGEMQNPNSTTLNIEQLPKPTGVQTTPKDNTYLFRKEEIQMLDTEHTSWEETQQGKVKQTSWIEIMDLKGEAADPPTPHSAETKSTDRTH
jgi:hypothetical protein